MPYLPIIDEVPEFGDEDPSTVLPAGFRHDSSTVMGWRLIGSFLLVIRIRHRPGPVLLQRVRTVDAIHSRAAPPLLRRGSG
jgi:hypothetical protein